MNKPLNIFSFISVIGILVWLSTELYGGMVMYALFYWWLVIPVVFGFAITLIITISRIVQNGLPGNRVSASLHALALTAISAVYLINSELLKSKVLLEAVLNDDLSAITIKLRADNTFDTKTYGMLGYVHQISGEYHLDNDTIVFHQPPYSNNFIPTTVLIDRSSSALFFKRLNNQEFDRTKSFANYFEIREIKL